MVLALIAALVGGQLLEPASPDGPIYSSPSRLNQYAFFEAFPLSGAGTYGACPLPNWVKQSETFEQVEWIKFGGGGPAAPTVTANQAMAPDGTMTADRLQVPAAPGSSQTFIYQDISSVPYAAAVWVKGNGTTGTLTLCSSAGCNCACAYNPTTWTQCTATLTGAQTLINIGNDAAVCGAQPAQDVFIWGAQLTPGAALGPYTKTTTTGTALQPTGVKNEPLTFSRTGNAYCSTQGLATTGLSNSSLVLYPANMARVEYDSAGTLGLRVESARTNYAVQSQGFATASWRKLGIGRPAPTVEASDGGTLFLAPDGTPTAQRVVFSQCDGGGQSLLDQLTSTSAGAIATTFYVRPTDGGTAAVDVCAFNVAGSCTHYPAIDGGAWTRVQHLSTAAGGSYATIGCSATYTGSGGVGGDILVWGAQNEQGAYATSYIPTTTAAATRNAEVPSFAVTGTSQVISMAATLTPEWAYNNAPGGASAVLSMNGANASTLYNPASTTFRLLSGGVSATGTIPNAAPPWRIYGYADGVSTEANWAGTAATPGAAGAAASRWGTSLGICEGTPAGIAGACNGIISRVCLDPSPTRCR